LPLVPPEALARMSLSRRCSRGDRRRQNAFDIRHLLHERKLFDEVSLFEGLDYTVLQLASVKATFGLGAHRH